MSRFKDKVNFGSEILEAARKRVADIGKHDLSDKDIDDQAAKYLSSHTESVSIFDVESGVPLSSLTRTEQLRDIKFSVEGLNRRTKVLDEKIVSFSKDSFSSLSEIQREANSLASEVSEQEIRILGNYDKVHLNTANRGMDMQLAQDDKQWTKDFKTGFSFLEHQAMHTIVGAGFTFPIREQAYTPIISATIVDEETDTGDTITPLISSPPENIFLSDKVFRYAVVRTDYDVTSRLYKQQTTIDDYPYSCVSSCAIQLDLPNSIAVNFIEIEPIAGSSVSVSKVKYLNEAGEEIELVTSTLSSETNLYLIFSPIYTRYLKIVFQQYAPIARTDVAIEDKNSSLNLLLEGAGFQTILPESISSIKGRVYDFSLKNIKTGFIAYENAGLFRSKPILVNNPLSVDLSVEVEATMPPSERDPYGNIITLPDGRILYEAYIGAKLETNDGASRLDALIPVPDSYPWQTEFLFPVGSSAKAKLFPDLRWSSSKLQIVAGGVAEPFYTFHTTTPHNLSSGSTVNFIGSHKLNGSYSVAGIITPTVFYIDLGVLPAELEATLDLSDCTLYLSLGITSAPIDIYKGPELLSIGSNYQISLDAGSNWHSDWPVGGEFEYLYRVPVAGNFRIRFINKDPSALYWIKYRVLRNQRLLSDNSVYLKNGKVMFGLYPESISGTLNTVIVFRTNTLYPYVTPILREYSLKIQESKAFKLRKSLPSKRGSKLKSRLGKGNMHVS